MSSLSSSKPRKIEWYDFRPVSDAVFTLRRLRDSDDPRDSRIGDMLRPLLGQHLVLYTTVTDADLAQAVLCSMYSDGESLLPGMTMQRFVFDSDTTEKQKTIQTLRALADQLENEL